MQELKLIIAFAVIKALFPTAVKNSLIVLSTVNHTKLFFLLLQAGYKLPKGYNVINNLHSVSVKHLITSVVRNRTSVIS